MAILESDQAVREVTEKFDLQRQADRLYKDTISILYQYLKPLNTQDPKRYPRNSITLEFSEASKDLVEGRMLIPLKFIDKDPESNFLCISTPALKVFQKRSKWHQTTLNRGEVIGRVHLLPSEDGSSIRLVGNRYYRPGERPASEDEFEILIQNMTRDQFEEFARSLEAEELRNRITAWLEAVNQEMPFNPFGYLKLLIERKIGQVLVRNRQ